MSGIPVSVKVDGKKLQNPVKIFLILMRVLGILVVAAVLAVFLIVPHFVLRKMGRQGFFKRMREETKTETDTQTTVTTSFEMCISEAFRRIS